MGIETTLKRAELFLGLDDAALLKVAELPSSHRAEFPPGEIIFKNGASATYLYVLVRGQVDLVADLPSEYQPARKTLLIDRITTGSCFGWSALVRPHFYAMSAICTKPTEVVTINGTELMGLLEEDNHIGYIVFQSLSHIIGSRLRDVEKTLASYFTVKSEESSSNQGK